MEQYESESWRTRAACRGVAEISGSFYPFYGDSAETGRAKEMRIRKAMQYCASCLVREACLESALDMPDNDGIWGGTDEAERRAIKRARRSRA